MKNKGFIVIGIIILLVVLIICPIIWYLTQIQAPKGNGEEKVIEITSGTSTVNIVKVLKENKVIKSELATKIYIKLNGIKNLQAGKYSFSGNENLKEVINKISTGGIVDETVTITFKEGKNIRYIAATIAEKTNNTTSDVYNLLKNQEYIKKLIEKYWFITDEILNQNIYYPLEGYLYPDTYTFENKDVKTEEIFEKMLDKMDSVLLKYKNMANSASSSARKSSFSAHELLTMASIVELEGNNSQNRERIASVIYNRIEKKMSLGSDVTTYYAIKVDMGERNLTTKEINTYNAYNTRGPEMAGKLPVGPIANPSEEAIKAVLFPADSEFLYFVADKNGDIYFTKTYEEHQEKINTLKRQGLWFEY